MAARMLQPSEYEIQREVEALKDLRRRSTTPGALTIDPDLPNQSPPVSPTAHWPGKHTSLDASPASSQEGSSSHGHSDDSSSSSRSTDNPADDPLHLFWVPASLHPEIAPAEFRAFLKEHARSPVDVPDSPSSSSSSLSVSSSLSRKKSMLSRQYRPKENDGVEDENVVPLKRNRSLLYPTNQGPQLTISDLRMLEELVEEASDSADSSKLRSVLRRSLSLNIAPSAPEFMDGSAQDLPDEADAPIIVPPPGQILRRAARTKIRKPGLQGDGGGHRFPASRRGAQKAPRTSTSDVSSSDHGDPDLARRPTISDDGAPAHLARPESYSEEHAIYDAYARDDDEEPAYAPPVVVPPVPDPAPPPQIPSDVVAPPVLHQPQPQRMLAPPQDQAPPPRTPSPSEPPAPAPERPTLAAPMQPPPPQPPLLAPSASTPPPGPKQKGSKSSLFKWGSDKGGKKGGKDKEREGRERTEKDKDKDGGFFGSLFGGGRKKQDAEYPSSMAGGAAGREAAAALLGASKSSKAYVPPASPGLAPGIGGNPYARYPIHVERAIYRLSHIKLANPRRPLYEQVLISNLMFWYLGVINKAQNPAPAPPAPAPAAEGAAPANGGEAEDREERERTAAAAAAAAAAREREQREKDAREKAKAEDEQRERDALDARRREGGRRGSLTKTPPGRRAETPIKGPQYEMQHRVMEQEYGGYTGAAAGGAGASAGAGAPRSPTAPMPNGHAPDAAYYYPPAPEPAGGRAGLPPGAMQPAARTSPPPGQQHQQPQQRQRHPSPTGGGARSQSPPAQRAKAPHAHAQLHKLHASQESLGHGDAPRGGSGGGGGRAPGRSLSATAYTAPALPPANGAGLRKGNSAHAAAPAGDREHARRPRASEGAVPRPAEREEEDVPLAVWQQQRRK